MASELANFFDITLRDSIDAQLRNGSSDSFFLFSGPPAFTRLASGKADALCPLLYTNSFNDPDGRPGDMPVGSFGTSKVVMANSGSNPGPRSLQIGSAPLVTSHPKGPGSSTDYPGLDITSSKWNFLKRLFYWLIEEEELVRVALLSPYIGQDKIEAIAPDINDIFQNFSRSPFYKIPFGIFAIALTKNMETLSAIYYEGCTLQDVGGQLTAGMGMPIQLTGSSGAAITYTKPYRLTEAQVTSIVSYSQGTGTANMLAAIAAITGGPRG